MESLKKTGATSVICHWRPGEEAPHCPTRQAPEQPAARDCHPLSGKPGKRKGRTRTKRPYADEKAIRGRKGRMRTVTRERWRIFAPSFPPRDATRRARRDNGTHGPVQSFVWACTIDCTGPNNTIVFLHTMLLFFLGQWYCVGSREAPHSSGGKVTLETADGRSGRREYLGRQEASTRVWGNGHAMKSVNEVSPQETMTCTSSFNEVLPQVPMK